jgi:hypothetical protein
VSLRSFFKKNIELRNNVQAVPVFAIDAHAVLELNMNNSAKSGINAVKEKVVEAYSKKIAFPFIYPAI